MPFGKDEEKDFIEHEVKNVFSSYKNGVEKNLFNNDDEKSKKEFDRILYKPACYYLFGSFDLAVISLVDDFQLATQKFHPSNESFLENQKTGNKSEGYMPFNYTFQVMSCAIPDLSCLRTEPELPFEVFDIEKNFENTPISPDFDVTSIDSKFLIGISALKLNNLLLIGNGLDFVKLALKEICKKLSVYKDKITYIIADTFSWNELSILFFSNDFTLINSIILELRNLSLRDFKDTDSILYDKVKQNALANICEDKDKIDSIHILTTTHTTFGYHTSLMEKESKGKIKATIEAKDLFLNVKISTKPGRLNEVKSHIKHRRDSEEIEINNQLFAIGKNDYSFVLEGSDVFGSYLNFLTNDALKKDIQEHVKKINTLVGFKDSAEDEYMTAISESFSWSSLKKDLCFSSEQLSEILSILRNLRVSKITKEKVLNMFVMFNDGICDPILYGFFIELRYFLEDFKNLLQETEDKSKEQVITLASITGELDVWVNKFERAHMNRFGQSYVLSDVTDYNIELNGGVHQLLSIYDFVYKSFTHELGEGSKPKSFVLIGGLPEVTSTYYTVSLNYFHLFHPIIFAIEIVHEAANYLAERLHKNNKRLNEEIYSDYKQTIEDFLYYDEKRELKGEQYYNVVRYFLIDMLTLKLAYNNDFENFYFWHFNDFAQSSSFYNTDGRIQTTLLQEFMMRMILMAEYSGNNNFFDGRLEAPFIQYQNTWNYTFPEARFYAYALSKEHKDYFNNCVSFVNFTLKQQIIEIVIPKDDSEYGSIYEEFEKSHNQQIDEIGKIREIEIFRKNLINNIADKVTEKFKKGEVFAANDEELKYFPSSLLCNAILLGYRNLIKYSLENKNNYLIARNGSNKVSNENNIYENENFAWDILGGVFSFGYKARRDMQNYRFTLLKTLWHLSHHYKKKLFQ